MTVIDTPEGIANWRLLSLISQLGLELSTGQNFYGSKGSAYVGARRMIEGLPERATVKNKCLALKTIFDNLTDEAMAGPVCTRAKAAMDEVMAAKGWAWVE